MGIKGINKYLPFKYLEHCLAHSKYPRIASFSQSPWETKAAFKNQRHFSLALSEIQEETGSMRSSGPSGPAGTDSRQFLMELSMMDAWQGYIIS